jgi:hypothetical protein
VYQEQRVLLAVLERAADSDHLVNQVLQEQQERLDQPGLRVSRVLLDRPVLLAAQELQVRPDKQETLD